jgi:AcrR family transcriptional regulator
MARPREFDEDEALDAALRLFWERGFSGTSVQELCDATGLSRASLYGAFGDKQQLFARALNRYGEKVERADEVLSRSDSVVRGLEALLLGIVDAAADKASPRGCFLQLAGTHARTDEGEGWVRERLDATMRATETMLAKAIRRGQASGELRKSLDATDSARFLMIVQQGIAVAARAGWSRARLEPVVAEAMRALTNKS